MHLFRKNPIYTNSYQAKCTVHRQRFDQRPAIREIFYRPLNKRLTSAFMLHWSALSAGFAAPIGSYLQRAGERCREQGYADIARFFLAHAAEEDGHDEWGRKDAHRLAARWNRENPGLALDAERLLGDNTPEVVQRYYRLHEGVIDQGWPWAELAIDVEIELLTAKYGPRLLWRALRSMGLKSLADIQFLRDHVRFDFGHTRENFRTLHQFIHRHPECTQTLTEVASEALEIYADLMQEALDRAHATLAADGKWITRAA